MSTVAIVLIVIGAILLLLFAGGTIVSARRRGTGLDEAIGGADRALAHAHATDRGWDRALLEQAATRALSEQRPDLRWERLELVLVDDRPGVAEDRAHMRASGGRDSVTVVLARSEHGDWAAERVE